MSTTPFQIELPNSKAVITFRSAVYRDKSEVYKNYDKETGVPPEDLIAIRCIVAIDGESTPTNIDPVTLIGQMSLNDFFYYFDIFSALNFSDMEKRESAKETAKKLLSGESLIGTQKKSAHSQPTGKSVS